MLRTPNRASNIKLCVQRPSLKGQVRAVLATLRWMFIGGFTSSTLLTWFAPPKLYKQFERETKAPYPEMQGVTNQLRQVAAETNALKRRKIVRCTRHIRSGWNCTPIVKESSAVSIPSITPSGERAETRSFRPTSATA